MYSAHVVNKLGNNTCDLGLRRVKLDSRKFLQFKFYNSRMIGGEERFNPFEAVRLQKARVRKQIVGGASLSQQKTAVLATAHLLNRAMPWGQGAAWLRWLLVLYRCLLVCVVPSCTAMWRGTPMESACQSFVWALCFVQPEITLAAFILFAAYLVVLVVVVALSVATLVRVRKNRQAGKVAAALFVVTRVVIPVLSASMVWLFTDFCKWIVIEPSVGNFFVSLFALLGLVVTLGGAFMSNVIAASNPIPDISDPFASWSAECWYAGTFSLLVVFNFVILSIARSLSKRAAGILVLVYDVVVVLPFLVMMIRRQFCINYWGHEFCMTVMTEIVIMFAFVGVWMVGDFNLPYWVLFCVWFGALLVVFVAFRVAVNRRLRNIFMELEAQTLVVSQVGTADENTTLLQETQEEQSSEQFVGLKGKSPREVLEVVRAACVYNSPVFMDLSLLEWALEGYPQVKFELLQLAFLIPDNDDLFKSTIDSVQGAITMKFKHYLIIYQMMMTIQESSN